MSGLSIGRSPITPTGIQVVSAVVDHDYINKLKQQKESKRYFDIGPNDSVFNVRPRQMLMARKRRDSSDPSLAYVVTAANGMILDPKASISSLNLPDQLVRALCMQSFVPFGVAFGSYDMMNPNESGLSVLCAGVCTVHAHVDIPAGARIKVTTPSAKEMTGIQFQSDSPMEQVPFILTPVDDLIPGQVLKHAVRAQITGSGWDSVVNDKLNNRHLNQWGQAAASCVDSGILQGIMFCNVLIQTGIIKLVDEYCSEDRCIPTMDNSYDIAGAHLVRERIRRTFQAMKTCRDNDIERDDRTATSLSNQHLAISVMSVLASLLLMDDNKLKGVDIGREERKCAKMVKTIASMAMFQDGETHKVVPYQSAKSEADHTVCYSTMANYVPGVNNGDVCEISPVLIAHASSVYAKARHGAPHLVPSIGFLMERQMNHLSGLVTAYYCAIRSEEDYVVGKAAFSARAGDGFDITLGLK